MNSKIIKKIIIIILAVILNIIVYKSIGIKNNKTINSSNVNQEIEKSNKNILDKNIELKE